jgi:hypothetical protein
MVSALRACARASIVLAINSQPFADWELAAERQSTCDGRVMDPGAATLTSAKPEAVNVASNVAHSTGANEIIAYGIGALPSTSYLALLQRARMASSKRCNARRQQWTRVEPTGPKVTFLIFLCGPGCDPQKKLECYHRAGPSSYLGRL